jgi:hypothetical protein
MNLVETVERYVEESFRNSLHKSEASKQMDIGHSKNTLNWVKQLHPSVDSALEIAALGHDISRAFEKKSDRDFYKANEKTSTKEEKLEKYNEAKIDHALACANYLCDYLSKEKIDPRIVSKVRNLVENHETGGFFEADILCSADAMSFIDNNFDYYLKKYGKEKAVFKLEWSYNRLKKMPADIRERAIKLIQGFYENDLKILRETKE